MISAQEVNALRIKTGAGMMDCKKALVECDGNEEKAIKYLREKGMAAAAKKADRIAAEGVVWSYIHMNGKIGVLVEINCETDFVAKSEPFLALAKDVAMQIAASKPLYILPEEVPQSDLDNEKEILKQQALNEGKPEAIIERMVEGRIKKYYSDVCLMEQPYIRDGSKTIREIVNEAILTIGEKISIRRFTRYEMGEGLEKRNDNLADEVAKQMNNK